MNKPSEPEKTTANPSVPADSLVAGLAAGFGRPAEASSGMMTRLRDDYGAMPPVLLRDADGEGSDVLRPKSYAMPKPGEAGERYQLAGEIARGGMGAVIRGRDVELGRELAIKVLLEKYVDRPEIARRFIEEAQIGGQLQHPGVVPVYDIGNFGERPFFTMKLVKGRTLAAILSDRTEPAEDRPRLLAIALQVAQTLAYAHAKAVIHRDLKPANIMVGAFGEVQVMDWGLAKVLAEGGVADEERASRAHHPPEVEPTVIRTARSSSAGVGSDTEAGSMLGTPAYMPPEQANGDVANLDRRADVFGLGAILCEILTGKPPYIGRSGEEVRRKAANGNLADALARLDACEADSELVALTTGCLSPEAIDRPNDAQAVTLALTAYLDGVQGRLRRAELDKAAALARAAEERRRRRAQAGLAAALVAVAALALFHASRQDQANRRITLLAGDLEKESGELKGERGRLQAALSESNSRLARLDLERGRAAFEKGEIGLGMVWTLESLKMATEARDAAARRVALDNLAAWRRSHVEVNEVFSHGAEVTCVAFSPDGKTIATGDWVNRRGFGTSRPVGPSAGPSSTGKRSCRSRSAPTAGNWPPPV
jgi:eukaryotic-like serine/threonine-protein kinase